jgi:hypothetical protein
MKPLGRVVVWTIISLWYARCGVPCGFLFQTKKKRVKLYTAGSLNHSIIDTHCRFNDGASFCGCNDAILNFYILLSLKLF